MERVCDALDVPVADKVAVPLEVAACDKVRDWLGVAVAVKLDVSVSDRV